MGQNRGITPLNLPGKVYSKVLERRVRPIVKPHIEEEQCGFRPGHGTTDQVFTLAGIQGSAVLHALHCTVVMKRELSWKAKLSIYQSVFVPNLTYGHEQWIMTERTRLRVQGEKPSHPEGTWRRAASPLRGKELVEVFRASDEDDTRVPS